MKHFNIYIALIAIVAFITSCDVGNLDNYDEPNGQIYGAIMDDLTNEPFQSEQPNGYEIVMNETDGNIPIRFWGKPDGTFENAWIFQNDYDVHVEGAFFPVTPVNVAVTSRTEVNFNVVPFLAVADANVQTVSGKITASYKISRQQIGDKISEIKTLVSDVPTVSNAVFVAKKETDVSGMADEDILSSSFTDEIADLEPGIYYVRIAAKTQNPLGRYNYSKVFKVTVP